MADDAETIAKRGLRMARRDPDRTEDATEGLEWLNQCHKQILADGTPWTFMEVTGDFDLTKGQRAYDFSAIATELGVTAIERVVALQNADLQGTPLKGMHWKQLERSAYGSQDDPEGPPVLFAQVGLGTDTPVVNLWPVPDKAYTMHVLARLKVADLTANDTPLIPDEHAGPILSHYVAARMWDQRAGREAAEMARGHDERYLASLARLSEAYGSAREEDITFMEPGLYDHYLYRQGGWG